MFHILTVKSINVQIRVLSSHLDSFILTYYMRPGRREKYSSWFSWKIQISLKERGNLV